MPDILDEAKEVEMQHRKAALDEFLASRQEPEQHIVDGQVLCIACHCAIESALLKAKPEACRCITCQQTEENKHGHR